MTEYIIQGHKVVISTELENYRLVEKMFAPFYASSRQRFDNWYREQYDVVTVYKNINSIKNTILSPIVDSCVSFLTRQKVYTIDAVGFRKRYINDCFDELDNILSDMRAMVAEIDGDLENAAAYRKLRKANRDRYYGFGLTRESDTRAKLEAGMKNAASGALHSIGNGIGNFVDSVKARYLKEEIYRTHREILAKSVEYAVDNIKYRLMRATEDETAIRFKLVSKENSDRARAMISNLSRVPQDQRVQHLTQVLQLDPYVKEAYRQLWIACGDASGELERLSKAFDAGLSEFIKEYVDDFANKNDERYCSDYNACANPEKAVLMYEGKIRQALDSLIKFCDSHSVTYKNISFYKKYLDALNLADDLKRTVDGVVYDTVEIADGVRRDTETFYKVFEGLDLSGENKVYETILTYGFESDEFKKTLKSRVEREITLRRPELLFENLKNEVSISKYANKYGKEIEIERFDDSIRQKRGVYYYFCEFSAGETAVMLLDRFILMKGRGSGKSGFLVTNKRVHIYKNAGLKPSKVSFDLYNIEKIDCLGPDSYAVVLKNDNSVNNGYRFELELELGMDIYQENELARLLTSLIRICQNIPQSKMLQISRIYKDGVECSCGAFLLPGEICCPSCHKFLQKDGSFIESMICPGCRGYVKITARFCTVCGHSFEESDNVTEECAEMVECKKCHSGVKVGKKFCSTCGSPMKGNEKSFVRNDLPINLADCSQTNDIDCMKEGLSNKQETDIMRKEVSDMPRHRFCTQCGNEIKLGKNFCARCGKKVI